MFISTLIFFLFSRPRLAGSYDFSYASAGILDPRTAGLQMIWPLWSSLSYCYKISHLKVMIAQLWGLPDTFVAAKSC